MNVSCSQSNVYRGMRPRPLPSSTRSLFLRSSTILLSPCSIRRHAASRAARRRGCAGWRGCLCPRRAAGWRDPGGRSSRGRAGDYL